MEHLKIFNKKEDYNLEIGDNLSPLFPNVSLVEESGRKVMRFNPKPKRKATFNVKNVGDKLFDNAENLKRVGIGNEVIYEAELDSRKTTIITTKNDIYEFDEQYNFMPNKRYCGKNITLFTVEVDGGIVETDTVLLGRGDEWDGNLWYNSIYRPVSDLLADWGYLSDGVLYFTNENANYLAKYSVGIIVQRDNVFLDTTINVIGVEAIPTIHFITNETLDNKVISTERGIQIMMETTSVIDENTKIMLDGQIEDITNFYHTSNFLLTQFTKVNLNNGITTFCRYDENNNVQIIDTKVTVFNFAINPTNFVIKSPLNGCVEVWFETIDRFVSPRFGNSLTNKHSHLLRYNKIISDEAFGYCDEITKITIPDSVTSIGSNAFRDCTSLSSVTIPESVVSVGYGAFYNTPFYNNLPNGDVYLGSCYYEYKGTMPSNTNITIKNGTKSISNEAFNGYSGLTSIIIPDSVTSIGDCAFGDCSSLTSITIPSSVTSIGDWAFSGCKSLTSVTIPDSVTSIGSYPFSGCYFERDKFINNSSLTDSENWGATVCDVIQEDGLCINGTTAIKCKPNATNVTIPSIVTSIGKSAFSYCKSLTSIIIPDSVTSIGGFAFYGCSGLTSVIIPDSVTTIGRSVFFSCSRLTSIIIPDSVTSIGDDAFYKCSRLKSVIIPDSVTTIGRDAFYGCSGLTSIIIPDSVTSIGDYAFYKCSGLTSVIIPDSVTTIGRSVFFSCSRLTSVTIGNGVTSIGDYAFQRCTSLSSITCHATTAPTVDGYAFSNISTNGTLYVPNGSDYSSWLSELSNGWIIEYI